MRELRSSRSALGIAWRFSQGGPSMAMCVTRRPTRGAPVPISAEPALSGSAKGFRDSSHGMPGSGQGPAHSVPLSPSGYDDLAVDDGSSDDRQQMWRAVRRWLTMVVECAIDLDASIAQPVSRAGGLRSRTMIANEPRAM